MNDRQRAAARLLFFWACNTFGVALKLATGYLFPKNPAFDKVTRAACDQAGVPTTTDTFEAIMSEGVSCHWWLEGIENAKSRAYPGAAIITQLPQLVK